MNLSKKAKTGIIAAAAVALLLLLLPDGQRWKFTIEPAKVGKKSSAMRDLSVPEMWKK